VGGVSEEAESPDGERVFPELRKNVERVAKQSAVNGIIKPWERE
jgi:hypothetical protein